MAMALIFTMTGFSFAASSSGITLKDAFNIALKDAGLTKDQVTYVDKEFDQRSKTFEIEFTKKGTKKEFDYEISETGKILEKSVDYNYARNTGRKKLTKEDAISKVVRFSGFKRSTVTNGTIKLEKDDGQWIYEVKFKAKGNRYEYDVHARTGKILEYSRKAV